MTVHVFVGAFPTLEAALQYSQAQWQPAPDAGCSEEAYRAWEDGNPLWPMRDELDAYLDSDFIETIGGEDRFQYLSTVIADQASIDNLQARHAATTNVLVLIFSDALDGFPATLQSTSQLTYCGEYGLTAAFFGVAAC